MKKVIILLIFYISALNNGYSQRHDVCDQIIIGDFKCLNCTSTQSSLAKNIRNAVIQELKYPSCEVLNRERLADILERKDKEQLIAKINDLTLDERQNLKALTLAKRVLFGEMEIQSSDNSLLVTLTINNLETGVQETTQLIEIPKGEYDSHTKRERYIVKGINEGLLGKKMPADLSNELDDSNKAKSIIDNGNPSISKKGNIQKFGLYSFKKPYPYLVLSIGGGLSILGVLKGKDSQKEWNEYLLKNPSDTENKYANENNAFKSINFQETQVTQL
ncbi:MAG: hypothetical protein R2791_15890 [Saprospiraceae bacterium]